MTVAVWVCSLVLVAEFVMAPINLWTGRTLPAFVTFTGFRPAVARRVFAPVKLAGAVLVAAGLALRTVGIAGAAILCAVCFVYLFRLAAPGRRDPAGLTGFLIFGAFAVALLVLQTISPR
ncbi:MAG TPA: hypothetical protein VFE40_15835 [Jatrophihabitantaceae bacterium]|jgi:hypothetical protein|nr:hypothetical protein [Jatrophihabitantaceae bacterium]